MARLVSANLGTQQDSVQQLMDTSIGQTKREAPVDTTIDSTPKAKANAKAKATPLPVQTPTEPQAYNIGTPKSRR